MNKLRTQKRKRTQQNSHLLDLDHAKMLEARVATLAAKITEVQNEILVLEAQNYHLFTLVFSDEHLALCKVWGARDVDAASHIANSVARDVRPYQVIQGDQTGGKAQIAYLWCSQQAIITNLDAILLHLESSLLHIVLLPDDGVDGNPQNEEA